MDEKRKMVVHRPVLHQEIDNFTRMGSMEVQRGRPMLALDAFQMAYKRSLQTNSKSLQAACAFNLGATCVAAGHPERGLAVLRSIVGDQDPMASGDLFYNIAIAYEQVNEKQEMVACLEKAFKAYQYQGNMVNMESDISLKVASYYEQNRKWTEAAAWYSRCSELLHRQHRPVARLRTLTRQADCAMKIGDAQSAREALTVVAQVLVQVEEQEARARLYTEMGLVYMHLGNYDEAIASFKNGVPYLPSSKDPALEATLHQNLGAALNAAQRFEEAVPHHRAGIAKYGAQGNRPLQGHCFANLGFALNMLGNASDSREAYLHAHQAAIDANDVHSQWQCLEALGVLDFNAGDFARSVTNFQRSLAICQDAPEKTRENLVSKLKRAVQQQQDIDKLKNNPYLNEKKEAPIKAKVTKKQQQADDTDETNSNASVAIVDAPGLTPEVTQALERIEQVATTDRRRSWLQFYGRKSTEERLFPNPKKNRVLLFDDAILVPGKPRKKKGKGFFKLKINRQARDTVDADGKTPRELVEALAEISKLRENNARDGHSLTSVTSTDEDGEDDDEEEDDDDDDDDDDEEEDDEEDREAVRQSYERVLDKKPVDIKATSRRLEKLAHEVRNESGGRKRRPLPPRPTSARAQEPSSGSEDSTADSESSDEESDASTLKGKNARSSRKPPVSPYPPTLAATGAPPSIGTYEKPLPSRARRQEEARDPSRDFVDFFGGTAQSSNLYDTIDHVTLKVTSKSEADDPAYAEVRRLGDTAKEAEANNNAPDVPDRMESMTRAERSSGKVLK